MSWQQNLQQSVQERSLHHACQIMLDQPVTFAGTMYRDTRFKCCELILSLLEPEAALSWALVLICHRHPTCREVGLTLIERLSSDTDIVACAKQLAPDPQWTVRELIAGMAGRALAREHTLEPIIHSWTADADPYLVRAGIVAVKYAVHRDLATDTAIKLLTPALTVRHEYVRKNLGPYAIGDGLLRTDPSSTLSWLDKLCQSTCQTTRWNTATSFTSAHSRHYIDRGLTILTELSSDDRRFVSSAVTSALYYQARYHRDRILDTIANWDQDPQQKIAHKLRSRLQS